jgi:hypothetical protein
VRDEIVHYLALHSSSVTSELLPVVKLDGSVLAARFRSGSVDDGIELCALLTHWQFWELRDEIVRDTFATFGQAFLVELQSRLTDLSRIAALRP